MNKIIIEDKENQLNKLKDQIIRNHIGQKLSKSAIQLVFGEGSSMANIMFIGEAPGKKEDETGRPFVGASGKLLDQLLESINLTRKEVYITNIVKYRPEHNRDPSRLEKQEFMPILYDQIAIVNPRLVVTLGRHSASCFMSKIKISQDHGRLVNISWTSYQKKFTKALLPLFHPAVALYNSNYKKLLFEDFAIIPNLITLN